MARPLSFRELAAVVHVVGMYPQGASIEQIEALHPSPPNRRTLQRWLGLPAFV